MGIDGLLKFLRPVTQKQHISSFKNQKAGIDIMSWIYRGCYSCNFDLVNHGNSIKYLYYLLEMIEVLGYYNIKPIFVFDGRSFDLKSQTNQKRIKQKQQNKAKAIQLYNQGRIQQSRKYFSRCIFIDQKIISTTMNVMHTKNIQFMVAPYEADCQIAKLRREGLIDFAISQDSDLLAYGVNTIFKLNQNGECDYVDPNKWSPRDVDNKYLKEYFAMNYVNRVECAILAGTDYNPSIRGIGISRAVRNMYKQAKMSNVINKLKQQKIYADKIPENYQQLAQNVKMIFLFATVYNPNTNQLQFLNPDLISQCKPADMSQQELTKIVGQQYPQYISKQVYKGKTTAKDLTPRSINSVNIRQMFSVNKQNLLVRQTLYKKRKEQVDKARQDREKQIQNGNILIYQMKPGNSSTKNQSPTKTAQLTEEQKQKRRLQRKNRIIKLHDVMNSVYKMCDQQDQQDKAIIQNNQNPLQKLQKQLVEVRSFLQKSELKGQNNIQKKSEQKYQQIKKPQQSEESSQQDEQNSRQIQQQQLSSESVDLAFLNPFAKSVKDNQKTGIKQQNARK